MTIKSAHEFLLSLQRDAKLRAQVITITREGGNEGRAKFLKEKGYSFSLKDLNAAKLKFTGRPPADMRAIVDFISCGLISQPVKTTVLT